MSESPIDPRFAAAHYGHDVYPAKPVAAQEMTDDARECLMDVISHHHDFVAACEKRRDISQDRDDESYWSHQIDVLNRMQRQAKRALASQPSAAQPAAAQPIERKPCQHCGDTGDVHDKTGGWRGRCTCPAGAQPSPSASDVRYAALEEAKRACQEQSIRFAEAMNGTAAYGARECEKAIRALKSAPAATEAPATSTLAEQVIGCFQAAQVEGLEDALRETTDARLKDLVERRLMYALYAATEAGERE